MDTDLQDNLRKIVNGAFQGVGDGHGRSLFGDGRGRGLPGGLQTLTRHQSSNSMSGLKGVAAGAGAAALAPLAVKGVGRLVGGNGSGPDLSTPRELLDGAVDKVGDSLSDKATGKLDEAGGPSGVLTDTIKGMLPFGGRGSGKGGATKGGGLGVGKGRRMPVQQSVDIGAPLETVYNQWTQFEDWPMFMHRVVRVTQDDPCSVTIATKIWAKTKEFTAEIETQRPDERIKWKVTQGMTHAGVVTFHELGPNLTRVLLGLDVQPGGLLEKAARGMRHIKRAARGDLHRFKAFVEMQEAETGAWRGRIEDGEVVEEHDPSYDEQRQYSDARDLVGDAQDDGEKGGEEDDGPRDEEKRPRQRQARQSNRQGASGRGAGSGSSQRGSTQSSGRRASGGSQTSRRSGGSQTSRRSSGSQSSRSGRSSSSGRGRSRQSN